MTARPLRQPPPDAPDWARHGYRLITETGLSMNMAAQTVGKDRMSLAYWIMEGEAERQRRKAKRWRQRNPERVRELGRRSSKKRRRERSEEVRAARRAWDRDPANRGRCTRCGGPRGIGVYDDGVCKGCVEEGAEAKKQQIVRLWAEGKSMKDIARAVGLKAEALGPKMSKMRKDGYDLPYRRRPVVSSSARRGAPAHSGPELGGNR